MTKLELAAKIQERLHNKHKNNKNLFILKNISSVLDEFFDVVKDSVYKGDRIELRGFGTFESRVREEKMAINPHTKQKIKVEKHRVPIFRPGKDFKDLVR